MQRAPTLNPDSLPPGLQVGAWRVLGLSSQGSSGAVYRVQHDTLNGPFALKLALQPADPRFALEVELLSRIHHPNVPGLHDSGQWSGPGGASFPFLVMDWVQGLSLYSWARLQPRSSRELLRVLAQAASALQAVHSAGGLHRDFKGDNLLVRPEDGHVTLVDLGSCTFHGAPVLTRRAEPVGTPQYLSPQALLHHWKFRRRLHARYEASDADDIYALGVTAYRVAAGRYPLLAQEQSTDDLQEEFFSFPALVPVDQLVQLSPHLARWIRQMMDVRLENRGTVAELKVGMTLAADTEGPEADRPIGPRVAADQVEPRAQVRPPRRELPRRVVFALVAAGMVLVAGGGVLLHALTEPSSPASERQHAQAARASAQDGDTTRLGEAALAERPSPPEPSATQQRISAPVPPEPLAGQRLPPCKKPEVEINGGCWILVGNASPPCMERTYEWRKQCYMPFPGPPRPSTSGER